jgi:type II secretory pathway pseudopilin PulG
VPITSRLTTPRPAFTVAEALVSVILLGLVGGLVAAALAAQQRSAREFAELRAAHADMRDAAAILARELRATAIAGDTLRLATDTAVEFFSPVLTGVACGGTADGKLYLTPLRTQDPVGLTSLIATPDTGDVAWVWLSDSVGGNGVWLRHQLRGYAESAVYICDPRLTSGSAPVPVLTLPGDATDIVAGAPVQVVRRGRYSVYRSADGRWYLGYRRCNALGTSVCGTVQPVAGPYRARTGATAGLRFEFFDENGAGLEQFAAGTGAARVRITVRSDTGQELARVHREGALRDSVRMTVAFRNWR